MYHSKKATTEQHAAAAKKPKQYAKHLLSILIAYIFIALLGFHTKDFFTAIIKDQDRYELRFQQPVNNEDEKAPKVWQLCRNGEFLKFVSPNDYIMQDKNGNIDLKYSAVIYEAKGLIYSAILTAMLVLVLVIAGSCTKHTPFTRSNAKRIKAIGYLQFSLAIVPGLFEFIMKMAKYTYILSPPHIESLYMLIIGFAIFMIGKIFDHGVSLQEENDLIA